MLLLALLLVLPALLLALPLTLRLVLLLVLLPALRLVLLPAPLLGLRAPEPVAPLLVLLLLLQQRTPHPYLHPGLHVMAREAARRCAREISKSRCYSRSTRHAPPFPWKTRQDPNASRDALANVNASPACVSATAGPADLANETADESKRSNRSLDSYGIKNSN